MYSISSSDKIKRCPCCGNQYPTEIRENNTVYVHCGHCGFKTKEYYYTDKQKAIDEWNNSDSPWHTGTPTEEGYYLVQLRGYYHKDTIGKIVAKWERNRWRTIHGGSYWNLEEDIKEWLPIELNKETD